MMTLGVYMTSLKHLSLDELITSGICQEANRQFFHPLGLALTVIEFADGSRQLSIQDLRDDPEGFAFADDWMQTDEAAAKAKYVRDLHTTKAVARQAALGYIVQPVKGE